MNTYQRYRAGGALPLAPPPFLDNSDDFDPSVAQPDAFGPTALDDGAQFAPAPANGPNAQLQNAPQMIEPSARKDAMDQGAGKAPPPLAGAPVAPPPPPPPNVDDETTSQPDGPGSPPPPMAGAPRSRQDIALEQYANLKPPAPPHENMAQKIAKGIISFSKVGPEGAEQIVHPNYSSQMRDFQRQKGDLTNQVKLADQAESISGNTEARLGNAEAREQNALNGFQQRGGVLVAAGQKAPDGYVPIPSPFASNPKFAGSTAWLDPHFGKFMVTPAQAELSNNGAAAGQWLPLSEMSTFIKGGIDQGKEKADTGKMVAVSPATAHAVGIESKPGPDGLVMIPAEMARIKFESDHPKESKEAKLGDNTLLELRSQGQTTGVPSIDRLSTTQAQKSLQRLRPPPQSNVTNFNLSPEAKQMLADQAAAGGGVPSFGSRGGQAVADIYNQAADTHKGIDLASAKTDYAANAGAIKGLEKQRAQVLTFENTAAKNLDLANQVSQRVDRTGSPAINRFLLHAKGQYAGDTDTQLLNNAVETAASEYAKVVSGGMSGPVSDSARQHAREMLTSAMGKGTFSKAVDLMKQEMGNRRSGYEDQLKELRSGRKGAQVSPSQAASQMETQTHNGATYQRRAGSNDSWVKAQ